MFCARQSLEGECARPAVGFPICRSSETTFCVNDVLQLVSRGTSRVGLDERRRRGERKGSVVAGRVDGDLELQEHADHGIIIRVVGKLCDQRNRVGSHGGGVCCLHREDASAKTQTAVAGVDQVLPRATVKLPGGVGEVCKSCG